MAVRKERMPSLPEAELDVLSCLLQQRRQTARDIREALAPVRPMAHASVVTLLTRLEAKHLVRKEKGPQGKAFVYEATQEPAQVYRSLVGGMLNRVFGGNGMALVHSLFEAKPPDAGEIDQLQDMLDRMRTQRAKGEAHE
ncbi:MAG: BlaI/MecI/CopY family transcriptional regulator [Sedimentisphaerales bacterium]|nr:BlaI/MecI/CopY family transcriptional regulator [Sedimentisphaerales bacterium]